MKSVVPKGRPRLGETGQARGGAELGEEGRPPQGARAEACSRPEAWCHSSPGPCFPKVTKEGGWVRLASSLASCSRCLGDAEPAMPLQPCAPQPHPFLLLQ